VKGLLFSRIKREQLWLSAERRVATGTITSCCVSGVADEDRLEGIVREEKRCDRTLSA
jgi:hypothetical protein